MTRMVHGRRIRASLKGDFPMRQLILGTAFAACFCATAFAADPASGRLTAANDVAHPLTYTANGSDSFTLTSDLPAGYAKQHPDTYIQVLFTGAVSGESESL